MDFLDDTLCRMSKGFECLKSTANMGLGFCCSVGEASFESRQKLKKKWKGQNVTVSFSLTFHWIRLFTSFHSDHFLMRSLFRSFSLSPVLISVGNIVCASHKTNCEVVNYMVIEYRCRLLEDEKKMRTNPQNEINENARKPKLKSQYVSRQNYLKIKLKS